MTFAEVVGIVDGHVLGGRDGLYKTLNKFVIGAMKLEAMVMYIETDSFSSSGTGTMLTAFHWNTARPCSSPADSMRRTK